MLARIALALVALCLPLLFAELALRINGSAIHDFHYELIKAARLMQIHESGNYMMNPPGGSVVIEGHPTTFNSFGMRDVEPRVPKPEDVCRLLILGDSVTYGSGVAQESIYGYVLRRSLAGRAPPEGGGGRHGLRPDHPCRPGEASDVVVAGVSGWNTVEQLRFLRTNVAAIDPDLVLLMYVVNDRDLESPFFRARKKSESAGERLYRTLTLRSRLFEQAAFVYKQRFPSVDQQALAEMKRWENEQHPASMMFEESDPGWRQSREALLEIDAIASERGARLVVFSYRLVDEPVRNAGHAALLRLSESSGIPVHDCLPFFARYRPRRLMNRPPMDPHPNARGHALLAKGLEDTLVADGYLPKPQVEEARTR